jgi:hypothetical protein
MGTALFAAVIAVSVFAFAGVQALVLYRRTRTAVRVAAEELEQGYVAPKLSYTPRQKRLYIASMFVSTGLFIAGLAVEMVSDAGGVGLALVLVSVGIVFLRLIAVRVVTGRSRRAASVDS